jgi:hypothetical protein
LHNLRILLARNQAENWGVLRDRRLAGIDPKQMERALGQPLARPS